MFPKNRKHLNSLFTKEVRTQSNVNDRYFRLLCYEYSYHSPAFQLCATGTKKMTLNSPDFAAYEISFKITQPVIKFIISYASKNVKRFFNMYGAVL